jgi:NAD(P)-dependent dehydrogenase (short-subunit alcohol dehydrogenase family)
VSVLADQIKQTLAANQFEALDVLVNNAGTFMDKLTLTAEGIEKTIATNHIAPFLLTHLLFPLLANSPDGRVLTVSSGSHYNTFLIPERIRKPALFISLWQYKVSKLANVLFSLEFNEVHKGSTVHAFAVDPGLVNTDIGLKGTGPLSKLIWQKRQHKGVNPLRPAASLLYMAGEPEVKNSNSVYWYDCKEVPPSRVALDRTLAHRLWVESEKLCKIR